MRSGESLVVLSTRLRVHENVRIPTRAARLHPSAHEPVRVDTRADRPSRFRVQACAE